MNTAIAAAFGATIGFASGDVFTALFARKVSGKASMIMLSFIKLLLYIPFIILWHNEYTNIGFQTWCWIILLGTLFTIAYLGFNLSLQLAKNPALTGVVAGCFPASAAVVTIIFLGQKTSLLTIMLLVAVLTGVVLIGLPENWRKSMKMDKGLLLALLPLICWGIFGALLNEPVREINTPHDWFVVQSLIAVIMVLLVGIIFNKQVPAEFSQTSKLKAWQLALPAGIIIGLAEAFQALSLGAGKEIVIIETILGSYPAVYFLIANKIFKEPLNSRQWSGVILVAVSIILLSSASI
jgi:drug/metabolite transporter (DMT)-like permease